MILHDGRKKGKPMEREVRPARREELDQVMDTIGIARALMRSRGNSFQWMNGYPTRPFMEAEVEAGETYVCLEDGLLVACFSLLDGDDPTYARIDGAWLDDGPYRTLHRLAVAKPGSGLGTTCLSWACDHSRSLRADTHRVNLAMQGALEGCGFVRCGTIWVADGSERIAYQHVRAE